MKERPILYNDAMALAVLDGRKTQIRRPFKEARGPSLDVDCDVNGVATLSWLRGDGPGRPVEETTKSVACPFGVVGDRLWGRESAIVDNIRGVGAWDRNDEVRLRYRSDGVVSDWIVVPERLKRIALGRGVPNGVFREGARILQEIVSVRVERIQDITADDAKAEGLAEVTKNNGRTWKYGIPDRDGLPGGCDVGWPWTKWHVDPRRAFQTLWDDCYGGIDKETKKPRWTSWKANPWVWVIETKLIAPLDWRRASPTT